MRDGRALAVKPRGNAWISALTTGLAAIVSLGAGVSSANAQGNVDGQKYDKGAIVTLQGCVVAGEGKGTYVFTGVKEWPIGSVDELQADHLAAILELKPTIVLLGTGAKFQFPDPARLAPLYKAGIGVEVMDTPAACRTYNILLGEGRDVLAALIL